MKFFKKKEKKTNKPIDKAEKLIQRKLQEQ
jgi:hypothetical protein